MRLNSLPVRSILLLLTFLPFFSFGQRLIHIATGSSQVFFYPIESASIGRCEAYRLGSITSVTLDGQLLGTTPSFMGVFSSADGTSTINRLAVSANAMYLQNCSTLRVVVPSVSNSTTFSSLAVPLPKVSGLHAIEFDLDAMTYDIEELMISDSVGSTLVFPGGHAGPHGYASAFAYTGAFRTSTHRIVSTNPYGTRKLGILNATGSKRELVNLPLVGSNFYVNETWRFMDEIIVDGSYGDSMQWRGATHVVNSAVGGSDKFVLRLGPDGQPKGMIMLANRGFTKRVNAAVKAGNSLILAGEFSAYLFINGVADDYQASAAIFSFGDDTTLDWKFSPTAGGISAFTGLAWDGGKLLYGIIQGDENVTWPDATVSPFSSATDDYKQSALVILDTSGRYVSHFDMPAGKGSTNRVDKVTADSIYLTGWFGDSITMLAETFRYPGLNVGFAAAIGKDQLGVTGLLEMPKSIALRVYPNPTEGILNIETEASAPLETVEVYDIQGKRLLAHSVQGSSFSLNLEEFSSGVYLLKCASAKDVAWERFVKQ